MKNQVFASVIVMSVCTYMGGCAQSPHGADTTDRVVEARSEQPFIRSFPASLRLDTGTLLREGDLYVVLKNEVFRTSKSVHFLMMEINDIRPRPQEEYDGLKFGLVHVAGDRKRFINRIEDLRCLVDIKTKEQAAAFADLIGGRATCNLFENVRGCEVADVDTSEDSPYYKLPLRWCSKLGSEIAAPRRITSIADQLGGQKLEKDGISVEGFVIERMFYMPGDSPANSPKLVASFEFVSSEGFYEFGIRRILDEEARVLLRGLYDHHEITTLRGRLSSTE